MGQRSAGSPVAVVVLSLLGCLVMGAPARAATDFHYGPPNATEWALTGRTASGGAGTQPVEYPSPAPWNQPAGDYCTAYKFVQPSAPTSSAPFTTPSGKHLADRTGFDPGAHRTGYQVRHNAQPDSSACQAKGATWGFWVNAGTAGNFCASWCGVRHDYSTGMALGIRPWSGGSPDAGLVIGAYRHVQGFSGNLGWAYLCAMVQDTASGQRLEYCLRVWRSWSGGPYDAPIVFRDPFIGAGFASIVTDLVDPGTPYAVKSGGASTTVGTQPAGAQYRGAITRTNLLNAIRDTNAKVRSANLGLCLGLFTGVRCYSENPDDYALLGVEDGLELQGTGQAHFGGYSTGLTVSSGTG